jgi:hypothetical protein
MNFKVIDLIGNTIGYIVNSQSEGDAQKMATKSFDDYFDVRESSIKFNVPNMFSNCAMDVVTIDQFQDKNNKGIKDGKCNLSSCKTNQPATWYNHGSYAYYCEECAIRLNTDPYNQRDAIRLFGHALCTKS